jgi:carbamate kinase
MPEGSGTASTSSVLVALGGNAILSHKDRGTPEEQKERVRETCQVLAELVREGHHIAVTHGNGPQVGDILLKNEMAKDQLPPMTFDICGAESQGMIGYMIQQSLRNELMRLGIRKMVATILTQTLVHSGDPAFQEPSKPIGPFYTAMEASNLRNERGWTVIDDAGRGFRRVVPSPEPIGIVEGRMMKRLFEEGFLLIASGGGGVPVVENEEGMLHGVEAVIDKDHSAALLGIILEVEALLILTDVEQAYLNFNRSDQEPIGEITADGIKLLMEEGHFLEGSMYPKVDSAVRFVAGGGRQAIITTPERALEALRGEAGTIIHS